MAIDLKNEHVLTLREAPRALPPLRRGRPVHVATVYRWASRGVSGVVLETVKVGRTRVTSREALQRFAERLAARDGRGRGKALPPTSGEARIERELDEQGF